MGTLESEILLKSVCLSLYTGGLGMLIVGDAEYLDCIHSYARFPSLHRPHRVAEPILERRGRPGTSQVTQRQTTVLIYSHIYIQH